MNEETFYITTEELAVRLSISPKTIRNNTHRIMGRAKIGGAVRYDWNKIQYTLQSGKNLFGKEK